MEMRHVDGAGTQQAEPAQCVPRDALGFTGGGPGERLVEQDETVWRRSFEDAGQALGLLVEPAHARVSLLVTREMRVDGVDWTQAGRPCRDVEAGLEQNVRQP